MQAIRIIFSLAAIAAVYGLAGQNLSARSNQLALDFSNGSLTESEGLPVITWIYPSSDYSSSEENRINIKVSVNSKSPVQELSLELAEDQSRRALGKRELPVEPDQTDILAEQGIWLPDGTTSLKISVTTTEGVTVSETRSIAVGKNALDNVLAMDRKDYALMIATDKYENWDDLVNPVDDTEALGRILEEQYGFHVDIMRNPTQDEIWKKLQHYSQDKKYNKQDQLLVFFAGHGHYDDAFGEGYVVPSDAKKNDVGRISYISHNRLRGILDNIDCEHILLAMDVCFGGTFDPVLARARSLDSYTISVDEMVLRKLSKRTRKYLTSGGKEYVSDGIPGRHSPFAASLIQALNTRGGADGILTMSEIKVSMEQLPQIPRFGSFGSDDSTSDFVFIAE